MAIKLLLPLIIVIILNLVGLLVAYKKQSDKLTDAAYSLSFLIVAIVALIEAKYRCTPFVIALVLVGIWASRLGYYLLKRVIKNKKDKRFDGIRNDLKRFGLFWVSQGLTAWILMLPILFLSTHSHKLGLLSLVGLIIWVFGFSLEALADYQKSKFKADKANKSKWIQEGIWHYSRHPNYFGEIMIWIGIYVICAGAISPVQIIISLVSPIFITVLLVFVSGIPKLEESADKKWGNNPEYMAYKKRTSILIPFPNKY
jgi:steroid 5-alpha reductase family enzyme